MSLVIEIDVSEIAGGARAFASYPARLQAHLLTAMTESMHTVMKEQKDRIPASKSSGTLRRSWNEQLPPEPASSGLGYTGIIGTNIKYARAVEFGFHGPETVRAHIRSVLFGKTVSPFTIPSFTRQANQPAEPYAVPGLEAAKPAVLALHQRAVRNTLAEMKNAR